MPLTPIMHWLLDRPEPPGTSAATPRPRCSRCRPGRARGHRRAHPAGRPGPPRHAAGAAVPRDPDGEAAMRSPNRGRCAPHRCCAGSRSPASRPRVRRDRGGRTRRRGRPTRPAGRGDAAGGVVRPLGRGDPTPGPTADRRAPLGDRRGVLADPDPGPGDGLGAAPRGSGPRPGAGGHVDAAVGARTRRGARRDQAGEIDLWRRMLAGRTRCSDRVRSTPRSTPTRPCEDRGRAPARGDRDAADAASRRHSTAASTTDC